MKIIKPQTSKGPADRFTGDVHPTMILSGEGQSKVRVASVHFAPGARTAWHSHSVGQYLHVVEGIALIQERGKELSSLRPGDTIYTSPGVEHWHGASPDSFMVHLAIFEAPYSGDESTWGDLVTKAEYSKPAKPIS